MIRYSLLERMNEAVEAERKRRAKEVDDLLRAELTIKGWDVDKLLRSRRGKNHCKGIATVMYDGNGELLGVDARRPCWWEKRLWGLNKHGSKRT